MLQERAAVPCHMGRPHAHWHETQQHWCKAVGASDRRRLQGYVAYAVSCNARSSCSVEYSSGRCHCRVAVAAHVPVQEAELCVGRGARRVPQVAWPGQRCQYRSIASTGGSVIPPAGHEVRLSGVLLYLRARGSLCLAHFMRDWTDSSIFEMTCVMTWYENIHLKKFWSCFVCHSMQCMS
jgi:hypothetical protein